MLRRLALATALCIGAVLCLVAAPASAQYQPVASQVLDSSTARPGDSVGVSGTGCPANSTVTTSFDDTQVGSTTADGQGAFSLSITIPANASPGTHTITSTCGSVVLSSTITILGAGGTNTGGTNTGNGSSSGGGVSNGSLARTGLPTGRLLQVGFGVAAAGGAVLALSRSRRIRAA